MTFEEALKLVGLAEGEYTNDPTDSGGETICGISRKNNPDSKIWEMLDNWKERGNTPAQLDKIARGNHEFMALVNALYRGKYWNTVHCDEFDNLFRYPLFSCCVLCGITPTIKMFQRALGVKDDGKIGQETYKAARLEYKNATLEKFYDEWHEYCDECVRKKPKNAKFIKGWHNRINNVKRDNH